MRAVIQPGGTCNWITAIDTDAINEELRAVKFHRHVFFAMRRLRKLQREVDQVERETVASSGYIHRTLPGKGRS